MDKFTTLTPITSNTSCGYHRITLPFGDMVDRKINKDSVLFFNRVANGAYRNRYFLDLDDYWILPKTNPHYQSWRIHNMSQMIVNNVKGALAVTVTNERLASKVMQYNKNVHIVPNALPFDTGQFTKSKIGSDYVFAGGVSHTEDIKLIEHIKAKYFGGLKGSTIYPLTDYMKSYDNKLASLVPLQSGEFNECKSNLKILEAGAKGIGCIASGVYPYLNDTDKDVMFYGFDKLPSAKELKQQGIELAKHVRKYYDLKEINKKRFEILGYYINKL